MSRPESSAREETNNTTFGTAHKGNQEENTFLLFTSSALETPRPESDLPPEITYCLPVPARGSRIDNTACDMYVTNRWNSVNVMKALPHPQGSDWPRIRYGLQILAGKFHGVVVAVNMQVMQCFV